MRFSILSPLALIFFLLDLSVNLHKLVWLKGQNFVYLLGYCRLLIIESGLLLLFISLLLQSNRVDRCILLFFFHFKLLWLVHVDPVHWDCFILDSGGLIFNNLIQTDVEGFITLVFLI